MLIDGAAKTGKTVTALRFAFALAGGGPVYVIEAGERGATEKYHNEELDGRRWEFEITQLESFSPENYTEAIREAERQGAAVIVIDSLTPEWIGRGGTLQIADRNGHFSGWKTATPLHDGMFDAIAGSPCHVIATVRSKMSYVIETDEKGRMVPRKIGLAPIQRDTAPYEFDIILSMDAAHVGTVSGSRCRAIEGATALKPGAEFLGPVIDWLETGEQADPPRPSARIEDSQVGRVAELLGMLRWPLERIARDFPRRYGVTELARLTHEQADSLIKWLEAQHASASRLQVNGRVAPQTAPAAAAGTAAPPPLPLDPRAAKFLTLKKYRDEFFDRQGISDPEQRKSAWTKILAKRGVASATALPDSELDELLSKLAHLLNTLDIVQQPGGPAAEAEREAMRQAAAPPAPATPPARQERKEEALAEGPKSPGD
jgi:hypothetical protein